jgi:hypothetical protein
VVVGDAIGVREGIGGFASVLPIIQGGCLSYAFACGMIWGMFPYTPRQNRFPPSCCLFVSGDVWLCDGIPPKRRDFPRIHPPLWGDIMFVQLTSFCSESKNPVKSDSCGI